MRRLVLLTALACGCENSTEPSGVPYSVDVGTLPAFLEVGDRHRYEAIKRSPSGANLGKAEGTWSSSNPAVVSIDQTGLAQAHTVGFADIIFRMSHGSVGAGLMVIRRIAGLRLTPDSLALVVGNLGVFEAAPVDASGLGVTPDGRPLDISTLLGWRVVDVTLASLSAQNPFALVSVVREGRTTVFADMLGKVAGASVAGTLVEFSEVHAGGDFSCGLDRSSRAYCWGNILLDLKFTESWRRDWLPRMMPVPPMTSIATGGNHACGLLEDGTALCWGSNFSGALGIGTAEQPAGPRRIDGIRFTALSAGLLNTCGLALDRSAWCWGARHLPTRGPQTATCGGGEKTGPEFDCDRLPVLIPGSPDGYDRISTGSHHTCALDSRGRAWCWGAVGRPGFVAPKIIDSALTFTTLASGSAFSCGLTPAGRAYCWGSNSLGQLGDGSIEPSASPVPVATDLSFVALAAGSPNTISGLNQYGHACGVTLSGDAYCWGMNTEGQGGDVSLASILTTPTRVPVSVRFRSITSRESHTCAMSVEGLAWCWGRNQDFQAGVAAAEPRPPGLVAGQRGIAP